MLNVLCVVLRKGKTSVGVAARSYKEYVRGGEVSSCTVYTGGVA